jgi:hypothetical protein
MDLTPQQIQLLQRLHDRGFAIVAFPMYANYVGVRKRNCAVLLAPVATTGFTLFGQPSYLIDDNLSVRITDAGRDWFVWKKLRLEATPERNAELAAFSSELSAALLHSL